MIITLTGIAKRFGNETVFRGVDHVLESGSRTVLLGGNGSGKSTLLQVIAGALMPSEGNIAHALANGAVEPEAVYRQVAIAAPYLNLYEDLSLADTIATHAGFKPFRAGMAVNDVARTAYLDAHLNKPVRNLSSGMRQRLKLALAILSDTPLLLLDEPVSNLDARGIAWFRELLRAHVDQRTLVVASNHQMAEHDLCTTAIEVERYKH